MEFASGIEKVAIPFRPMKNIPHPDDAGENSTSQRVSSTTAQTQKKHRQHQQNTTRAAIIVTDDDESAFPFEGEQRRRKRCCCDEPEKGNVAPKYHDAAIRVESTSVKRHPTEKGGAAQNKAHKPPAEKTACKERSDQ